MKHQIASALILSLSASLTACSSGPEPGPVPTGEGDLRYLIAADPAAVGSTELLARALDAEERTNQFHVVDGIYWQATRSSDAVHDPDGYGSGGDSMLFTGVHLAARTFKYSVTRSSNDLRLIDDAVRGTYILTHVSGSPGVLARCAFPTARAAEWDFPRAWQGRIDNGFVYESPPSLTIPPMTYYTRATRDQLSGLLYGLSVVWATLDVSMGVTPEDQGLIRDLREFVATTVEDVWRRLEADDFRILDHTGRNDTGADSIDDDLLRLQLLSLYRRTVVLINPARISRTEEAYQDSFSTLRFPGFWIGDLFNRFSNGDQYYAWNLRFYRTFSVWLLADPDDKPLVAEYLNDFLFKHVRNHKNAFFSATYAAVSGDAEVAADAVLSLKSWSLRPVRGWSSPVALGWTPGDEQPGFLSQAWTYTMRVLGLDDDNVLWPHLKEPTTYFVWQKDAWDNGVTSPNGLFDGAALDYSIVYWMGRHYGFMP